MRWTEQQYQAFLGRGNAAATPVAVVTPPKRKKTDLNKPEAEALALLSELARPEFKRNEDSFPVLGGAHGYTPDLVSEDSKVFVEVKGEHVHNRGSTMLFDAFRLEHPELVLVWMRKRTRGKKGRRWEVELYGGLT